MLPGGAIIPAFKTREDTQAYIENKIRVLHVAFDLVGFAFNRRVNKLGLVGCNILEEYCFDIQFSALLVRLTKP